MSDPTQMILVIGLIAYVLIRRMAGQPAQGKRLLILPVVIIVIGVTDLSHVWSPLAVVFLVGTTAAGFVIGILRGVSIKLSERGGVVWMRYTIVTVVLWAVNIGIKFAASAALTAIDPTAAHQESSGLLLSLGVGVLMEGVLVVGKAMKTSSRILWATGKDGKADRHSDFLDSWQRNQNHR